jgi:hypothetical protein
MNVRKIIACTLATLTLSACAPTDPGPDPAKDFWGNPISASDPQHCVVPSGPAPAPEILLNPSVHQRPKAVREGNSWIVIEYELRALPPTAGEGSGFDYCVPADVHVYAQPGDADVQAYGVNSMDVGPFDFPVQTPWIGRFIFLQYDPREERFAQRPPSYKITMEARYVPEKDAQTTPPFALGCKLKIDGGILAQDIAIITQRSQVSCTLTGNTYHTY